MLCTKYWLNFHTCAMVLFPIPVIVLQSVQYYFSKLEPSHSACRLLQCIIEALEGAQKHQLNRSN